MTTQSRNEKDLIIKINKVCSDNVNYKNIVYYILLVFIKFIDCAKFQPSIKTVGELSHNMVQKYPYLNYS